MCILVSADRAPVSVGRTRLFARHEAGMQVLVYSMQVEALAGREIAMILPLPVNHAAADPVAFIDLSGYPQFFDHLECAFPHPVLSFSAAGDTLIGARGLRPTLPVQEVGSFIASYVPSVQDFDRLDARFRLPDAVLTHFSAYAEYGFAVFQLKSVSPTWGERQASYAAEGRHLADIAARALHPRPTARTIHPMALRFATDCEEIFFPTVHFHGDGLHTEETFDHTFYWQGTHLNAGFAHDPNVRVSAYSADAYADIAAANTCLTSWQPLARRVQVGLYANEDTLIPAW